MFAWFTTTIDQNHIERLRIIVQLLRKQYGLDRHHNVRSAFWELVFIIISLRTAERIYIRTYRELRARFRTIETLVAAEVCEVERILQPAGLAALKAPQIVEAAKTIYADFGRNGLTTFGRSNYSALEKYLQSLRGVGSKVAKCVSMYACDAPSLPVDAHVWRVMSRLGYAPGGRLVEEKALTLEQRVPEDMRFAVHVLCISHGRNVCRPRPLCAACVISSYCPSSTAH